MTRPDQRSTPHRRQRRRRDAAQHLVVRLQRNKHGAPSAAGFRRHVSISPFDDCVDSRGIAPPAQTIDRTGGGVDQVWNDGSIGTIRTCAALILASLRPPQNRAVTVATAAGFIPAPRSIAATPALATPPGDASADVIADPTGSPAWFQMLRQRARKARALVRVRDVPRLPWRRRSFFLLVKTAKKVSPLSFVLCACRRQRRLRPGPQDLE